MSIYKKLSDARQEFHCLELKKSGWNDFAKYNYFELADFLEPALKVFRDVGIFYYVSFSETIATMTLVDIETSEKIEITSPMGSAKLKACHEVQNIGAVETYQRRYLLLVALEIVEQDAVDSSSGVDNSNDEKVEKDNDKESEKDWFNDFNQYKDIFIQKVIKGESTPQQLLSNCRKEFKVSTKTAEEFLSLSSHIPNSGAQ